jgi:hypothetical protein
MQKMMMNENELATRWNISPKTLQRWRSEGRGPRFMKMSKRVVYPIDEVLDFESQGLGIAAGLIADFGRLLIRQLVAGAAPAARRLLQHTQFQ